MNTVDGRFTFESPDTKDYLVTLSFGQNNSNYSELLNQILIEDLLNDRSLKILGVTYDNECTFYYSSDTKRKVCLYNVDNLKYISVKIQSMSLEVLTEVVTSITKNFTNLECVKVIMLDNSKFEHELYYT